METCHLNRTVSVVTASRGGGSHLLDMDPFSSLEEVQEEYVKLFLPGGKNHAQDLNLIDLNLSLSTFSGKGVYDFGLDKSSTLGN